MAGLDVTEKAVIYPEDIERIRSIDNDVAKIVAGWFDFFIIHHKELGHLGAPLHDPCAVMALIHPEIFDIRDYYVEIDTKGMYTLGTTVVDYNNVTNKKPNTKCIVNVDREKFVDYLCEACEKFKGWKI